VILSVIKKDNNGERLNKMSEYYELEVAGLKRKLPICKISDDLSIAAFVIFGDVELTVNCARELLKKAPRMMC
jgi:adenine phosphoribosyltransferase